MASIAYITDQKMIDFHRVNGNQTMNFWRPSSVKRFSHFDVGDYLFFLAKGTEHRRTKEKGIIGYGKFSFAKPLSLRQMWTQYGTLNGYSSKKELTEAILKVSKNKSIPKTMHCLYLTDIIFFQAPVYLSEVGVTVSSSLESYIYLDRVGVEATVKILKKAQEVGVDVWQAAMDQTINKDVFKEDVVMHILAKKVYELFDPQKADPKIFRRVLEKSLWEAEYIKGGKQALISQNPHKIYFALEGNLKDRLMMLFELIGKISILREMIRLDEEISNLNIHFAIICDQKIPSKWSEWLQINQIEIIEL